MFWVIQTSQDRKTTAVEEDVLRLMAFYMDREGRNCWVGVPTLAHVSKHSERRVQRARAVLLKLGVLVPGDPAKIPKHIRGDRRPAIYDLGGYKPAPKPHRSRHGVVPMTPRRAHGVVPVTPRPGQRGGPSDTQDQVPKTLRPTENQEHSVPWSQSHLSRSPGTDTGPAVPPNEAIKELKARLWPKNQ